MKNLMYKEFMLAIHPTVFIFLAFDLMLLIPSYPYYVAFIYTCLAIFFIFLSGRENKDVFYTVSLPIRKRDAVKARCCLVTIIETVQIIFAIPFAFLGHAINPKGNMAGIESNAAFFGFVFIMFAVFNILMIPSFYKTAYRCGKSLLMAGSAVCVYIFAVEAAVQLIKPLKVTLDTWNPDMLPVQFAVLAVGIIVYAATMIVSYRLAADHFEKVNL